MNISELYDRYKQTYLVCTDTRKIVPNSIFFALKGANFNGNTYALEALERGAHYAVVDEKEYQTRPDILLVDDVLKALQELATYHRNQLKIPIFSLTGSNGKTTSKELINAVLSKKYTTKATQGNLNNHIGVPLTLLAMTPTTEFGIVEMGANHQKEIAFLCTIAQPDYGYITNFGKAHLEGFGGEQGVIKGKSELYDYLREHAKIAFVNKQDSKQLEMSSGIQRVTFGDQLADVLISRGTGAPFVDLSYKDNQIKSQLIGHYNYDNIAAAVTIGDYFKVAPDEIKTAIENYVPKNNRSQLISKGSVKIILDAYNANPSSMRVALENLAGLKDQNKVVILGDMFELGAATAKEHQEIADLVSSLDLKVAHLVGEHFSKVKTNNAILHRSFEALKDQLAKDLPQNAIVLIKASRGMALERLLDLF